MPDALLETLRRQLSTVLVVVALVLATAVIVVIEASHSAAETSATSSVSGTPDRPNIVLISTDDQTLSDLKWMAKTRHLLGDAGMTFSDMLSPHPLCCPARAEILTGEFAQNNGVHSNEGPFGGYPNLVDPDNSIGSWLQSGGYKTAVVGKFLNKWAPQLGIPRGWDFWATSTHSSFGYYGFKLDIQGQNHKYPESGPYSTDYVSYITDKLIDTWAPSGSPFFIWSSYYAPHGLCGEQEGCTHPPEPAHKYAHYPVPYTAPSLKSPSFDEADVSDKPPLIQQQKLVSARFAQRDFTQRIRSLQSVDDAVERTLDRLQANGVLGDTDILFTSDNGYLIGEHRYVGKILPYEEALRVPLLVRGPGIAAGSTTSTTVTTVDLAATIADMAHVTPARSQDGMSLLPLLTGGSPPDRDAVLIQAGGLGQGVTTKEWLYRGIRTKRYTFSIWSYHVPFPELYDRSKDPHELNNLAGDPRYLTIETELAEHLKQLLACTGAGCNVEFPPLPAPG